MEEMRLSARKIDMLSALNVNHFHNEINQAQNFIGKTQLALFPGISSAGKN